MYIFSNSAVQLQICYNKVELSWGWRSAPRAQRSVTSRLLDAFIDKKNCNYVLRKFLPDVFIILFLQKDVTTDNCWFYRAHRGSKEQEEEIYLLTTSKVTEAKVSRRVIYSIILVSR